jgi:hypothetical protein
MMFRAAAWLLLTALGYAASEPGLELVYFHDDEKSSISIVQIDFLSASRGIAIGNVAQEGKSRPEPAALITADGGKTWTRSELPDTPVSLFCLDENDCWLVTPKGIYFSEEAGRAWTRISKEKPLTRVYFRDRQNGWAIGAERKLLQTSDGGKTWNDMQLQAELKTSEERTVFHEIAFLSPERAIIAGRVEPRREWQFPIWMQAEPEFRRELPSLSIMVQSTDGGKSWTPSTSSMFGRISKIRNNPVQGYSLALVEFDAWFTYPSEVYRIDNKTGATQRVLRRQTIAVTDIAALKDGSVLVAGFEPPGTLARTPVPGRVRVLRSRDLSEWTEVPVDYRAEARDVTATVAPDGTAWFGTDTGMILRYRSVD